MKWNSSNSKAGNQLKPLGGWFNDAHAAMAWVDLFMEANNTCGLQLEHITADAFGVAIQLHCQRGDGECLAARCFA